MAKTLDASNVSITLTIPGLFPSARNIEGFGVDDIFMTESIEINQTRMGVDGKMSFGQVPAIKPLQITLMPTSPSIELFELWGISQLAARTSFPATALVISSSGAQKTWTFVNGVLVNFKTTPDFKKLQEPVQHMIHFEGLVIAPFAA